jgi:hypothetical protein
MTTDAGSGFDRQAAGRDAGDERLEEETRPSGDDDAGDGAVEEKRERKHSHDSVNDAFGGSGGA